MRKLKTKNQVKEKTGTAISEGDKISLKALVDQGLLLDGVVKYATAELKKVKEQLMEKAKTFEMKKLLGENGHIDVQQSSTSEIGAVDMVYYLRENKKLALVEGLLKVRIAEAKKILGEDALKDIMDVETEAYGKLRFKAKGGNDLANIKAQINKHL